MYVNSDLVSRIYNGKDRYTDSGKKKMLTEIIGWYILSFSIFNPL